MYRSLTFSTETVGLWSERAVVPFTSCVVLPKEIPAVEYSGSLVNAITAYAFLEQMASEGHTGVIVTVGGSATGLAIAALARLRDILVLFLVRSERGAPKKAIKPNGRVAWKARSDAGHKVTADAIEHRSRLQIGCQFFKCIVEAGVAGNENMFQCQRP